MKFKDVVLKAGDTLVLLKDMKKFKTDISRSTGWVNDMDTFKSGDHFIVVHINPTSNQIGLNKIDKTTSKSSGRTRSHWNYPLLEKMFDHVDSKPRLKNTSTSKTVKKKTKSPSVKEMIKMIRSI